MHRMRVAPFLLAAIVAGLSGTPPTPAAAASQAAQPSQQYDLLLKGGHVIDSRNNLSSPRDVAIKDGKIAAVAAEIPSTQAFKTVDVKGLYVTRWSLIMAGSMFNTLPVLLVFVFFQRYFIKGVATTGLKD